MKPQISPFEVEKSPFRLRSPKPNAASPNEAVNSNAWFWGLGPSMADTRRELALASARELHVLIVGETGSGKELVAHELHRAHCERLGHDKIETPFVAVNCGAIPEALAESLLFGHERGAFTSARELQAGKFELARRGTLFLDEVQALSGATQIRLLRVLQSRLVERLGARRPQRVTCRVIAATNVPLELLVERGEFRKDLYYRLNICPVYIPPLRKRSADLPVLIKGLLARIRQEHKLSAEGVAPEVFDSFLAYRWPGNLRELEHVLLYAALRSGLTIEANALPPILTGQLGRYVSEGDWQP